MNTDNENEVCTIDCAITEERVALWLIAQLRREDWYEYDGNPETGEPE